MTALQKRVSKLEGPNGAAEQVNLIIHFIEQGTMQVTSRLRLIPGGGSVKVDEDGNETEGHITALGEKK